MYTYIKHALTAATQVNNVRASTMPHSPMEHTCMQVLPDTGLQTGICTCVCVCSPGSVNAYAGPAGILSYNYYHDLNDLYKTYRHYT